MEKEVAMGEAPHEVYTDAEKKARADKVCGNCKWWRDKGWDDEGNGIGKCDSAKFNEGVSISAYAETLISGQDNQPIRTLNTFGCIHFEPKT